MPQHHVVIVGGGFAGLNAAKALRRASVRVTLVDRQNHHLFQPLLYQVALAVLAPGDITEPIRSVLSRQLNASVRLGEVERVDVHERQVFVDGEAMSYDYLILAAGARHAYFGHASWEQEAPGLKTIGDALEIRRRILFAFERAEWTREPAERRRLMTFVVVGGGPTGVELAGTLAEIAATTLRRDFRHIQTEDTRVVLVEGLDRILPPYSERLRQKAEEQLASLGVEIRLGRFVSRVDGRGVEIGGEERVDAATVLWAAGNQASALGETLAVSTDRAGRVLVEPDLSIPGHPEVMVVGDQAHFAHGLEEPLPAIAPVAIQQGRHAARNIHDDLRERPRSAFRYRDRGMLATIGKRLAVGRVFGVEVAGFVAWVLWVFVHLMTLVGFRNRLVVFVKWAWIYFTNQSSSRVIWQRYPGEQAEEEVERPARSGK